MNYQRGDRIVLVHTSDPHTRLVPGTAGTVTGYNARLGQLAVAWDDGSTLAMLLHDGDQVRPLGPAPSRPRAQRRRCAALTKRAHHEPGEPPGCTGRKTSPSRHRRQQAAVRALRHLHPARR